MTCQTRLRRAVAVMLAAAPFAFGCSSDGFIDEPSTTIVGTWNATHITAQGTNLVQLGMGATATFNSPNTYSFSITGDLAGICAPATSCTQTGTWAATATQLTLTPSVGDPLSFSYSIIGSTMTWTGTLAGIAATVTLVKQ